MKKRKKRARKPVTKPAPDPPIQSKKARKIERELHLDYLYKRTTGHDRPKAEI